MKKIFLQVTTTVSLTLFFGTTIAKTAPLGTASNFVLFTSVGAVQNEG